MLDALHRWLQRHGAPATAATSERDAAADGEPLLIDVRSAAEHHRATLPGAINLPLGLLEQGIAARAPDRSQRIVLFCASGARSASACRLLQELGYLRVENAGGLHAASARLGLPVVEP